MTADHASDELRSSSTKVIHGTTNVVQTEVRFFHKTKNKADTYMNYTRSPLACQEKGDIGIGVLRTHPMQKHYEELAELS